MQDSAPTAAAVTAFEFAYDAMFLLSDQLKIVHMNRAAEQLTGQPRDQLVGRFCGSVFNCDTNSCWGCRLLSTATPVIQVENHVEIAPGERVVVNANYSTTPVDRAGKRQVVLTIRRPTGSPMAPVLDSAPPVVDVVPSGLDLTSRRLDRLPSVLDQHAPVLSERQLEILQLVSQGFTNAQIAERLYITENTVKTHIKHILERLNVRNRAEAVAMVMAAGWIKPGVSTFASRPA